MGLTLVVALLVLPDIVPTKGVHNTSTLVSNAKNLDLWFLLFYCLFMLVFFFLFVFLCVSVFLLSFPPFLFGFLLPFIGFISSLGTKRLGCCCCNCQVGVAEMKVAVERTGGIVVHAESFGHSIFKGSLRRIFQSSDNDLDLSFK
jgi:hypothetical protein